MKTNHTAVLALAVFIINSISTINFNNVEAASTQTEDSWRAEKAAVTAFIDSLDANLPKLKTINTTETAKGEVEDNGKIDLAEVGKSFTAARIEALGKDDFSLAGYTLGKQAVLHPEPFSSKEKIKIGFEEIKEEDKPAIRVGKAYEAYKKRQEKLKKEKNLESLAGKNKSGVEIESTSEKKEEKKEKEGKVDSHQTNQDGVMLTGVTPKVTGYFTTYKGTDGSYTVYTGPLAGKTDELRKQGLVYHYADNVVTDIHVTEAGYSTSRQVSVGSTRGDVLYAYGIPNVVWRNPHQKSVTFTYEGKVGEHRYYQSFTLKDNKVAQIDYFDAQVRPRFAVPDVAPVRLEPNVIAVEDFSLMGYAINQPFVEASDDEWEAKGTLYNNPFSSYDGFLVSYDSHNLVSRVMLSRPIAVTRRGISIGDTKYLMLYLYGEPNFTEDGSAKGAVKSKIYGYKHPQKNVYLMFTVEDGQDFITSVMLSDRKMSELEVSKSTE